MRCSNNYVIKLRSSLRKFYGPHHDLVNRCGISMSQMTTDMFHSSEALFTVLSSFVAYHCLCNTTVVISGRGTAYPSGAHEFTPGLCCSIFSFLCRALQIVVCPFVLFLLAIMLFLLLQCTDFDYPLVSSNSYYIFPENCIFVFQLRDFRIIGIYLHFKKNLLLT